MRYLVVMALSLGVGIVVYVLSMRAEEAEPVAIGFEPPIVPPEEQVAAPAEGTTTVTGPSPGHTYLEVEVTKGPSFRERVQGLVGSIALVALAAVAVAGGVYAIGTLIGRLVRSFLGDVEP